MIKIQWHYPKSLAEASSLLEIKNIIPHGGGTSLINRDFSHVVGLLNLTELGLNYIKQDNAIIEIGSMSTYADILTGLKSISPDNILVKSLQNAANTPCRNRITIGGSISFAPKWSDVIGALLALEAKVVITGKNDGEFLLSKYLEQKELRQQSLITAVKFKNFSHRSSHYREVKTKNDMPLFTITALLKMDKDQIEQAKVFIIGTTERISQLIELENYLENKLRLEISEEGIQNLVKVSFNGSRITDGDYLSHKAKIETARTIFRAMEIS